jgi:hypothetical protein
MKFMMPAQKAYLLLAITTMLSKNASTESLPAAPTPAPRPPAVPSTPPASPDIAVLRFFDFGAPAATPAAPAAPGSAPNSGAGLAATAAAPDATGPAPATPAAPGGAAVTTASPGRFKPVSSTHSSHFLFHPAAQGTAMVHGIAGVVWSMDNNGMRMVALQLQAKGTQVKDTADCALSATTLTAGHTQLTFLLNSYRPYNVHVFEL